MVMEKPIGHNLESSKEINDAVEEAFDENQIFRIDHYLGKETVLNLLALRFANSIFTTNWNHNTVDHIQITVAEDVGIEGRWDYFDKTGQLRDMLQNHLLQILTFIAMEPPVNLEAKSIHNEKIKILKALRPITDSNVSDKTVAGQYTTGYSRAKKCPVYLEEEGATQKVPPKALSRCGWMSIIGAGPAYRFTYVPENGCNPNAPRLSSTSNNCRTIFLRTVLKNYPLTN